MNIQFSYTYLQLTPEEKIAYHDILGQRLLYRRYEYYQLDLPSISDFEYDFVERYYEAVSADLGLPSVVQDMVGFDDNHEASVRMLTGLVRTGIL